jgi:hypothetical protein
MKKSVVAAAIAVLSCVSAPLGRAQQAPQQCPVDKWGLCQDGTGASCKPGQPISPQACASACSAQCGPTVGCCSGSYGGVASSGGGGGGTCQTKTVTADVNNSNNPTLMVRSLPFSFTYGADTGLDLCKDVDWPGTVYVVRGLPFIDPTGVMQRKLPIELANLADIVGNCAPVVPCSCACAANTCNNSCNACGNCPKPKPTPPPTAPAPGGLPAPVNHDFGG